MLVHVIASVEEGICGASHLQGFLLVSETKDSGEAIEHSAEHDP